MSAVFWIVLVIATGWTGLRVLRAVPPLLHTPLMSGMNALSGITILASLSAWAAARTTGNSVWAGIAIALAMANVTGGFLVTHRMLKMFRNRDGDAKNG